NSVGFRYYKDPVITAIYPKYGLKDGNTRVEVWGENFLNFDQFTRCNFGSKSV
ncbi:MAG: IPT/TIG domain-containing protein, partial [Streptococcus sp.]|nr:IPT/TIG domain-containing protein [Streptococcus sp.]